MVKSRPCQQGICSRAELLPPRDGRVEGDLDAEQDVCAQCKVHCSYPGTSGEPASEDNLAVAFGGWCGPKSDRLAGGVSRRVQAFLQERTTVLHCDDLINKKDPVQVSRLPDPDPDPEAHPHPHRHVDSRLRPEPKTRP